MDDLTCAELVEQITAYLEGVLPPDDVARFRAHLTSCDGCEAYLDQVHSMLRALRGTPDEELTPETEAAIVGAFRQWSLGGTSEA
jgi:anti-sigma factor RsiW